MKVPNDVHATATARLHAALVGRYRIERELGAGGMATVYLAEDVRHKRLVALKVLHPELSAVLGTERFLKEIELTASLQHPHILPLFDSGEAEGQLYYVMPLVEGETLRARLERERQLPLGDALRIATEVADALGYAHARGVIHRDVKPENILLAGYTPANAGGGHALVADFGIALAVQQAGGARMTQTGLSLGTPQYMAPEQAMGERTVDARADVYALGAVTYEMLAGEPPFTGPTTQAIVARVMTEQPRGLVAQRKAVPAAVERAVLRALEKLPADRFTGASEFAAALRADAPEGHASTRVGSRGTSRLTAALACVTVASLAVAAWAVTRRPATPTAAIFDAALPDDAPMSSTTSLGATGFGTIKGGLSIAPSGTFVVYTATQGDSTMLWYRSLVDASAHAIPGTAGGAAPRISPDGAWLAFVVGDRTEVVPIAGGEPRHLMEGGPPTTLQWVSPSRLIAIGNQGFMLNWIDPEIGVVERQTLDGQNSRCYFGQWLAARRQLLCGFNETATIVDAATRATWPVRVRAADGSPGAAVSGAAFRLIDDRYLAFLALDGTLRAAPYDPATHLVGRAVALMTGIDRDIVGTAQLDLAPNGTLGFAPSAGAMASQLVVLHQGGEPTALPVDTASFLRFDLSRDRRRLAAVVVTPDGMELRIHDLRTGRQQTWLRGTDIKMPVWSPRGDRIAVRVATGTGAALLFGSPDAAAGPDTLMGGAAAAPVFDAVEFPDDSTILARNPGMPTSYRLHLGAQPMRVDTLPADAFFTTVSPDGRHLAWHTATAANQLFVSTYPPGTRRQLIASGAVEPLWLSATSLLFRSTVTWYEARIDPATGELVGPPTMWARDTRFVDTPGWSNRLSWDGGIIYARSGAPRDARYLRFVPDFVGRLRAAVDAANR